MTCKNKLEGSCKIYPSYEECPVDCPNYGIEERNYDKLLKAGNSAQLEKLKQNEHKAGLENLELKYMYKRLRQETRELWKELYWFPFLRTIGCRLLSNYLYHKWVRNEAADIANFAHMIIYKCDQELKKAF